MFNKIIRKYFVILGASIVASASVAFAGYYMAPSSYDNFPRRGYILLSNPENENSVTQLNFDQYRKVRNRFPGNKIFKDSQGKKQTVDNTSYIYFEDGSIGSFLPGYFVDMAEVGSGVVEFYTTQPLSVLRKNSAGWGITNNKQDIGFGEVLWKNDSNHFLAAGDNCTLYLANGEKVEFQGTLEIIYHDDSIVELIAKDKSWMTISDGTRLSFRSGSLVDLGEEKVYNSAGQECFTLAGMSDIYTNYFIHLNSDSGIDWQPPQFNIHNEDGETGETGKTGEAGQLGESGAQGDNGKGGIKGEDGEIGARGGGLISGEEYNLPSQYMGNVVITDIWNEDGKVYFTLNSSDPDMTLAPGTGTIQIRDAETGALCWSQDNLSLSNLDRSDVYLANCRFQANKKYILSVGSGYQMTSTTGVVNQGNTLLTSRSFVISTAGMALSGATVSQTGITLDIQRESRAVPQSAYVEFTINDITEKFPLSNLANIKNYTLDLTDDDIAEIFGYKTCSEMTNLPFTADLYITNNGETEKTPITVTGVTLKALPEYGKLMAEENNDGSYSLQLQLVSDKDKAHRRVRYVVVDENGLTVKELTVSGSRTTWYPDEGLNGKYTIMAYATWDDNVREAESRVASKTVTINDANRIVGTFKAFKMNTDTTVPHITGYVTLKPQGDRTVPKDQVVEISVIARDGSLVEKQFVSLTKAPPVTGAAGVSDVNKPKAVGCAYWIPGTNNGRNVEIYFDFHTNLSETESYVVTIKGKLDEEIYRNDGSTSTETSARILFRSDAMNPVVPTP